MLPGLLRYKNGIEVGDEVSPNTKPYNPPPVERNLRRQPHALPSLLRYKNIIEVGDVVGPSTLRNLTLRRLPAHAVWDMYHHCELGFGVRSSAQRYVQVLLGSDVLLMKQVEGVWAWDKYSCNALSHFARWTDMLMAQYHDPGCLGGMLGGFLHELQVQGLSKERVLRRVVMPGAGGDDHDEGRGDRDRHRADDHVHHRHLRPRLRRQGVLAHLHVLPVVSA